MLFNPDLYAATTAKGAGRFWNKVAGLATYT